MLIPLYRNIDRLNSNLEPRSKLISDKQYWWIFKERIRVGFCT